MTKKQKHQRDTNIYKSKMAISKKALIYKMYHKHSPSYNLPHLLCSAYDLVTLFSIILLTILLQFFLFLLEFIPFRFFWFSACQRNNNNKKDWTTWKTTKLYRTVNIQEILVPSSCLIRSTGNFLFFANFPSVGFLLNFCGPPSPPDFLKPLLLSVL